MSQDGDFDLSKRWPVKLDSIISYVDDFIFILTIPPKQKGIDEKEVANILIQEATNLLNSLITENPNIEFHKIDHEKTKIYLFNKDTIAALKTNFAFFNTADEYFFGGHEIQGRIDEMLLFEDGRTTLNQNQAFHRQLLGLQKNIIRDQLPQEKSVSDLLKKIKIKIEGSGSKYIISVFRVFRLLALNNSRFFQDGRKRSKRIKEIFEKFKKNNKYWDEWIKFFNGYFNFLNSLKYDHHEVDTFFRFLGKAYQLMESPSKDDKMLFRLLRNEYVYKFTFNHLSNKSPNRSLQRKALGDLKRVHNDFLLNLSNQRDRSIKFLYEGIYSQSKVSLDSIDLLWIGMLLNKAFSRNCAIDINWIFSIIKKLSESICPLLFDFGLSRIAVTYLALGTREEQDQFFKRVGNYNLMDSPFWKLAKELMDRQEELVDCYNFNEKIQIKRILKTLKRNNALDQEGKDPIWHFIKQSFHSEQHKICAYFIANRFNNENEFIKYILTSNLRMESPLLAPWSVIPLTFQKTGIHINMALKILFEMTYNKNKKILSVTEKGKIIAKLKKALEETKVQKLESFNRFGIIKIDLNKFDKEFFSNKFKKKTFKITLSPLDLDFNQESKSTSRNILKLSDPLRADMYVRGAIDEAVRQKSSILVFPEMSLPRDYIRSYLKLASQHDIVLIGGLEYSINDIQKNAYNSTIISIPVRRELNPEGKEYLAFEQIKNFPSYREIECLKENNFKYRSGSGIFIFKSDFWGDFAILTCSDFLSLGLRWILQNEVQTVFVPAQNRDSTTYNHISETSIRDLHCCTIVCNNPKKGSSHCYAPYSDIHKRQVFKKVGDSTPHYHTFEIDPREFRKTQQKADPLKPFREKNKTSDRDNSYPYSDYKQLPPDWNSWSF